MTFPLFRCIIYCSLKIHIFARAKRFFLGGSTFKWKRSFLALANSRRESLATVKVHKEKSTMSHKQIAEFHAAILQSLPELNSAEMQGWIGPSRHILRSGFSFLKLKLQSSEVDVPVTYLRRIFADEVITLDATDGTKTITQAKSIFTGYLDADFAKWQLDVPAVPTSATPVHVMEMTKDGTFQELFGSLGQPLEALCLTQHQIINFVVKHRAWLREDGYGTFFLFKVGDKFFVANVCVSSVGRLEAYVYRLSDGYVWSVVCRHRLVFPQLVV